MAGTALTGATAAGVAAAGTAIGGAALSTGVGLLGASGAFGKGTPPNYDPTGIAAQNFTYNPAQGATDLNSMLPQLQQFATQATAYQTAQREKIFPGAGQQFQQASTDLNSYLKGQVPQDVVDFTNRTVAQRTGGTFNPWTGGGNSQQDFARSIGQLSSNYVDKGLSMAPQWQQLANSFVTPLTSVAQLALGSAQNRYAYDALNSGININNAGEQYKSQLNQAFWQQQQANQIPNSIQTGIGTGAGLYSQLAKNPYNSQYGNNSLYGNYNYRNNGSMNTPYYSARSANNGGGD